MHIKLKNTIKHFINQSFQDIRTFLIHTYLENIERLYSIKSLDKVFVLKSAMY
jgi:hypothetical protein